MSGAVVAVMAAQKIAAAGAVPTFVSSSANSTSALDTTTTTAALNVSAGNLIVACISSQEAAFTPTTVTGMTDTAGNTYTACTALSDGGSGVYAQIWYAYNVTGNAANVLTATWSGNTRYKTLVQLQFSGANTTAAVFVAQNTGATAGGTVVTSGNLTTSTDSILVAIASSGNDRSWTPDTGFTEDYDINIALGGGSGMAQHKIQTGAGTYTVSATAVTASNLGIAAAAFK